MEKNRPEHPQRNKETPSAQRADQAAVIITKDGVDSGWARVNAIEAQTVMLAEKLDAIIAALQPPIPDPGPPV